MPTTLMKKDIDAASKILRERIGTVLDFGTQTVCYRIMDGVEDIARDILLLAAQSRSESPADTKAIAAIEHSMAALDYFAQQSRSDGGSLVPSTLAAGSLDTSDPASPRGEPSPDRAGIVEDCARVVQDYRRMIADGSPEWPLLVDALDELAIRILALSPQPRPAPQYTPRLAGFEMDEDAAESEAKPRPANAGEVYPVILNGDHAAFEAKWSASGRPANERPDWPSPSFDERDWAEAFCKINPSMDEGVMIAWFANALMRGYDERSAASPPSSGDGWRPISTAPKDGGPILGFVPSYSQGKGGIAVIIWMMNGWSDNRAFITDPTHWMPLPTPPHEQAGKEGA